MTADVLERLIARLHQIGTTQSDPVDQEHNGLRELIFGLTREIDRQLSSLGAKPGKLARRGVDILDRLIAMTTGRRDVDDKLRADIIQALDNARQGFQVFLETTGKDLDISCDGSIEPREIDANGPSVGSTTVH